MKSSFIFKDVYHCRKLIPSKTLGMAAVDSAMHHFHDLMGHLKRNDSSSAQNVCCEEKKNRSFNIFSLCCGEVRIKVSTGNTKQPELNAVVISHYK